MKILVHDYPGYAFPVQLSRELAKRGHTVMHAFASQLQCPRGELEKRADDPDSLTLQTVPMHADYAKDKYSFVKRRRHEIEYGNAAAKLVREWKPEVVLSGQTPTEPQEPILAASQEVGARFHLWLQDFYSIAVDKLVRKKIPVVGGMIGSYYKKLDRKQFQAADGIVAITDDFIPLLRDGFGVDPKNVAVVPNWAPLESLPVRTKDNAWAKKHGLDDKIVFLYTGTLGMKHDPALLLALAEHFKDDDEVRVVVVTEGIGAKWLEEQKATGKGKNLTVFPYQPFSDLPDVLGSGDIFVGVLEEDAGVFSVPSKVLSYHCAGRAILLSVPLENLAARTLERTGAGTATAPGDVDGFLKAAQALRDDPERRASCAKKARDYAVETFDIAAIAERFEKILG